MIIKCLHGFYLFEETEVGEVSEFMRLTGLNLVSRDSYFTFSSLLDVENYSLKGKSIGSAIGLKAFEGEPWEVFRANGLVYDFVNDLIVPISSIASQVRIEAGVNRLIANGLVMAGAFNQFGVQIKGYKGFYIRENAHWLLTEVTYE